MAARLSFSNAQSTLKTLALALNNATGSLAKISNAAENY